MQSQPHILYAEDDPDTRELVQLFLRQAGFRVSVTGDSSEVLSVVATDHIDALLLDNWMPGITGPELCRGIRSFDQSMPILLRRSHRSRQKSRVFRWRSRLYWKAF
jgi:two-component system, OmpR family, phosphate regulon response regulator OmpR